MSRDGLAQPSGNRCEGQQPPVTHFILPNFRVSPALYKGKQAQEGGTHWPMSYIQQLVSQDWKLQSHHANRDPPRDWASHTHPRCLQYRQLSVGTHVMRHGELRGGALHIKMGFSSVALQVAERNPTSLVLPHPRRDAQRVEELCAKNHQLREQQKALRDNVRVLENR